MIGNLRVLVPAVAVAVGAGAICPLCGIGPQSANGQHARLATPTSPVLAAGVAVNAAQGAARQTSSASQRPDTATARLHISGMTCGSCPTTARLALQKIAGVSKATVTLDDSLGVVHYDPRKVTPAAIAAELTRRTGYGAVVLAPTPPKGGR